MPSGNALVLLPLLWAVVAVCWAPMLLSDRVRGLFAGWPSPWLAVNYVALLGVVVAVQTASFLALGVTAPAGSLDVLRYAALTTLGIPALAWGVVVALPRVSDVETPDGVWLPLAVGAVWYALVVGVVFALLAFLLFVFFFPG